MRPRTSSSSDTLEPRRVAVFLVAAFGLSWTVAAVIYATGGLRDSPQLLPGVTLALVLLAGGYMFGPAVAHVVARLSTGEGLAGAREVIRPALRGNLRTYLLAWLAPAALTLAGAGLFFLLFPGYFDPTFATLRGALPPSTPVPVGALVAIQILAALTVAPAINALFAFGEEFGWRAYLLPKLLPLGTRRAVVLQGLIWGVWHWPVIAMGYNYGFGYPGAPWTGFLAMCWMTVATGVFLAWVTLRSGSVWPASIGHGAVNAVGGVGALFAAAGSPSLLGPTVVGVVVAVPWALVGAYLLADPARLAGGRAAAGVTAGRGGRP